MDLVSRVASSLRTLASLALLSSASCIYLTGVSDYEKGVCEGPCADAAVDAPVDAPSRCPSDMIFVDGGSYNPGAGIVRVDPLCVDPTEVTESAYRACVAGMKCTAAGSDPQCNYGVPGRGNDPINCVSLAQAKTFCEHLGKRLPTENEWQWVARGGNLGFTYPWENVAPTAADDPEKLCWQAKTKHDDQALWPNRPAGTCPVKSFPAGARDNIFDLAGNVWEWTSTQEMSSYIFRGGSAFDPPDPATYRVSSRRAGPSTGYAGIGFRCFKSAN